MSLRLNFSWTLAGHIVYAICQWGILVVLSKLGSLEMVGQFAFALAVTAPIVVFSNLALRHVLVTDFKHQYIFGDYLGLRLTTAVLALLCIAMVVWIADYDQDASLIIMTIGLAKAVESISDLFFGLLQKYGRMDRVARSQMMKGPLSILFFTAGVHFSGELIWGAIGLLAAWLLLLCVYDIPNAKAVIAYEENTSDNQAARQDLSITPNWDMATLGQLAWLALPLGISLVLDSLRTNIPRYFIEARLGLEALGLFAALAYLIVAGKLIIEAMGKAAAPVMARSYAEGNKKRYLHTLRLLLAIGLALGLTAIAIAATMGEWILSLLYQPDYAMQDLLVLLMVAAAVVFMASLLGHGVTAARYFAIQLPLLIFSTLTTIIACWWLVPQFELYGAATAIIVGGLTNAIGYGSILLYILNKMPASAVTEKNTTPG